MKSILILRGGALGDFLVTLPALGLLRACWPEARIELVGNRSAAGLGVEDGILDVVHSQHEARWAGLYAPGPLPGALGAWLSGFDCVVSWWPDPERELASHFPVREGQRFVEGAAKPGVAPAARHYCGTLGVLGLATTAFAARLQFPRARHGRAGDRHRVVIHPGSSSLQRNWPPDRWLEICRRVRREGLETEVVCGEAESSVIDLFRSEARVHAGLPLAELACLLASAGAYAGHDTGVTHLAAACGCPVLALFGSTDPGMWAPPGASVIRRVEGVAAIPVDEVSTAMLGLLRRPAE